MDEPLNFEPLYPDVLGAITGGARIDLGEVQAAIGVFPKSAYFNQPVEVIVIVQSMIDGPVEVRVTLDLPTRDVSGGTIRLAAAQTELRQVLAGGDVGVLRLPIVPLTPTSPDPRVEFGVGIARRSRGGNVVRSPMGSAPPSVLAVSPFKLQALREIEFVDPRDALQGESVRLSFDLASKQLPPLTTLPPPSYEPLWTIAQLQEERQQMAERLDQARLVAVTFTAYEVYEVLLRVTDELFAQRGLPLHPGEARAIAKLLTYTLSDWLNELSFDESNGRIEDRRWFQALAQTLAHDETVARWSGGAIVSRYLYESAVYDAVLLGFAIIRPTVRVNLGDRAERTAYADKLTRWLAGQAKPDLSYVYLPLVFGGLALNHRLTWPGDDPWGLIDNLREAYRGRLRLAGANKKASSEIFDMLDRLLTTAENDLKQSRILPT